MRLARPLLHALLATAAAAGGSLARPVAPAAQQALDGRAVLAQVARHVAGARYLRGRFEQRQESLLLDEPIVTRGRLFARREPGTVLLEVEGEHPTQVRSDATSHRVWHKDSARAERWVFERNEVATALLACLGADLEKLERVFAVTGAAREPAGSGTRVAVRLEPTDARVAATIAGLELVVDDERVVELRYADAGGDRVVLALSALEVDPPDWEDPDRLFDAPLPEGVELRTQRVPARAP